jgi:hypothetical protein
MSDNSQLVPALQLFFEAAERDVRTTQQAGAEYNRRNGEFRMRWFGDFSFVISKETAAAEKNVADICSKIFDHARSHEDDISDVLWQEAGGWQLEVGTKRQVKSLAKEVAARLVDEGKQSVEYVTSCYGIDLKSSEEITIGPVAVVKSERFLASTDLKSRKVLKIEVRERNAKASRKRGLVMEVAPQLWRVQVLASPRNIRDQALWLIDVAISLLRTCITTAPAFFPRIGDIEGPATEEPFEHNHHILVRNGNAEPSVGGNVHGFYQISHHEVGLTRRAKFKELTYLIFNAKKNSLAERVGQGLGWLTRARRAHDRAERLLYFFTAIEALLSANDGGAPVSQTISRHVAVILTDNMKARGKYANVMKDLYSIRSDLVHRGRRNFALSQTDRVQGIAEGLYERVLRSRDMKMSFDAFSSALAEASYGTAWKGRPPDATSWLNEEP